MLSRRFLRLALRRLLPHNGSPVSRCRKASTSANMAVGPYYLSTCASAASVCGSQKVISMAQYSAIAVDSAARASSRRSVLQRALGEGLRLL